MTTVSSSVADNNEVTISVAGRFDFSVQREFRQAYLEHPQSGARFKVDLSKAEYMDSSALGMLLLLREYVDGDSGRVSITGASPAIEKVLRIANFHQLFQL